MSPLFLDAFSPQVWNLLLINGLVQWFLQKILRPDKILSNPFRVVIPFFRDFQYFLLSFMVYMSAYRRVLATATFIFASFAVLYAAPFSSLLSLSMILLATFFVCMLSRISSFHHPVSLTGEGGGCWSNFRGGNFFNEF